MLLCVCACPYMDIKLRLQKFIRDLRAYRGAFFVLFVLNSRLLFDGKASNPVMDLYSRICMDIVVLPDNLSKSGFL